MEGEESSSPLPSFPLFLRNPHVTVRGGVQLSPLQPQKQKGSDLKTAEEKGEREREMQRERERRREGLGGMEAELTG